MQNSMEIGLTCRYISCFLEITCHYFVNIRVKIFNSHMVMYKNARQVPFPTEPTTE